ncbi:MAG: IclR family transcriptional regulator [Chloroflexota bacterium]|nr:MAG: IclR family transcriptional regulator [Chloroflexota bacterium]
MSREESIIPDSIVATRALTRGLDVLLCLAVKREAATANEIAAATGLNRTTIYRLLATLEHRGFVAHEDRPEARRFRLGPAAELLADGMPIRRGAQESMVVLATPHLWRLQQEGGEGVSLHVRSGYHRVCIHHCEATHPLRYVIPAGMLRPLATGASGTILMWDFDEAEVRAVVASLAGTRWEGQLSVETLLARIEDSRRLGYTIVVGDTIEGVTAIGAPVFGIDGRVIAAVAVAGPANRLDAAAVERLAPLVVETGLTIYRSLSGFSDETIHSG